MGDEGEGGGERGVGRVEGDVGDGSGIEDFVNRREVVMACWRLVGEQV